MPTLAERIEAYIRSLVLASRDGVVEIQRGDLAARFGCAPSQISYVLERRFTVERGYLVESKRGGGGYIRIVRLDLDPDDVWLTRLAEWVGEAIDQDRAEAIVDRLEDGGRLSRREAALIRAALRREVLQVELPMRDALRARLLKHMLAALWRATVEERRTSERDREGA